MQKIAVIIGAGPAGLTAAYELLERTNIRPIVIESDSTYVGGISRTINFKGNRIDIGGHRFFSKSDRVMRWWSQFLPVLAPGDISVTYQRTTRALTQGMRVATEKDGNNVLMVRPRKTRILYHKKFFDYPVSISFATIRNLGLMKMMRITLTYAKAVLFPVRPEITLEDFFRNRFGDELYKTFFKTYTEKVWGVPCAALSAEWGAQRIKGLSIISAVKHAARKSLRMGALSGKGTETSLIEQFLYPPFGPGQMWETVAEAVRARGGEIRMGTRVVGLQGQADLISSVTTRDSNGLEETIKCDYVFSTTDIKNLVQMLPNAPKSPLDVAKDLKYRDFITVGLLTDQKPSQFQASLLDTWLYIHEEEVRVGRIQLFHNWSPYLVANQENGWLGMEYFCNEGDELWEKTDQEILHLAESELINIGLGENLKVLDGTVIRQQKAYPSYVDSYEGFVEIQEYLDTIGNLYPVGRNGMHRYNNQDHSMLAAMVAVDLISKKSFDKSSLWRVNSEQEYQETR